MALLTVVGQGMKNQLGAAGRVFSALGHAGINVNMIDQGSDELNLIIGDALCEDSFSRLGLQSRTLFTSPNYIVAAP